MPAPVLNEGAGSGPAEWEAQAQRRGCYCGLWVKDPSFYPSRGIAPGYCGKCERCGAMGHTRHFPGPVPYTGSWCDRCYRIVGYTGYFTSPAAWIRMAILAAIAYAVFRLLLK